jgi:hypothetical protein
MLDLDWEAYGSMWKCTTSYVMSGWAFVMVKDGHVRQYVCHRADGVSRESVNVFSTC